MPTNYFAVEERIQEAIKALKQDLHDSIADAACEFNVPYQRFLGRINGRTTRRLLSEAEKKARNQGQEDLFASSKTSSKVSKGKE